MQALLLAGGFGSRLKEIAGDVPKPMIKVAGRPVLEHAIDRLRQHGVQDVHFFTGYKSEVIEDYFGNGDRFGMTFTYHVETKPMGTAGAVIETLPSLDEEFLILYGDTIFNIDISRMIDFHKRHEGDATVFLHPNDHPFDSDLVEIDASSLITAVHPKPHSQNTYLPNLVSAALYILRKDCLSPFRDQNKALDFAHDVFPALLEKKRKLYGYVSREYIKDMGTPTRLQKVETDILSGKVDRSSLATKQPAIFLDRDGTLTKQLDYVRSAKELVLEDFTIDAVHEINKSEYLAVLVTNQPVIARGEVTEEELNLIHNKMEQKLGQGGAYLDAIYLCPHHPDKGFEGENVEFKITCDCRKPGTKLIEQAAEKLNIDLKNSWFIGDTTVDIKTAEQAGLRSILVHTGAAGKDGKFAVSANFESENVLTAVQFILDQSSAT